MTEGVTKVPGGILRKVIQVLSAFDETANVEVGDGGWLVQSRTPSKDAHVEIRISDEVVETTEFPMDQFGFTFEEIPDLVKVFAEDGTVSVRSPSESKLVVSESGLNVGTLNIAHLKYKPLLESKPSTLDETIPGCISHGLKVKDPSSRDEVLATLFDSFVGEKGGMDAVEFELDWTGQFCVSCEGDLESFEYELTETVLPIGDASDVQRIEPVESIQISDGPGENDHLLSLIYPPITKFTEMDEVAIIYDTDGVQYLWLHTSFAEGAGQITYTILGDDAEAVNR